jgi:hypothetical protein
MKNLPSSDNKSVLVRMDRNIPVSQLVHNIQLRKYIPENKIKEIAIEKYRSSGKGITFEDVVKRFPVKKQQAQ